LIYVLIDWCWILRILFLFCIIIRFYSVFICSYEVLLINNINILRAFLHILIFHLNNLFILRFLLIRNRFVLTKLLSSCCIGSLETRIVQIVWIFGEIILKIFLSFQLRLVNFLCVFANTLHRRFDLFIISKNIDICINI
jgi:hypothetical protein